MKYLALAITMILAGCMESDISQLQKSFLSGHYENEIGESFEKAFGPMTWKVVSEGPEQATIVAKGELKESMGNMLGDVLQQSAEWTALGMRRDPSYAWKMFVAEMRIKLTIAGLVSHSAGKDITDNGNALQKKFLDAFKDESVDSFQKLGTYIMNPGAPVIASFTWDKKFGRASLDTLIIKNEYGGMPADEAMFYVYDYNIYGSRDFDKRKPMEH